MKLFSVSKESFIFRRFLSLIVFLMISSNTSADIVVGYIPAQGIKLTSTAWFAWFRRNVEPTYRGDIKYHEVENVELFNELMNTFSMVDFAVLTQSLLKEFRFLSGIRGPANIGDDSMLIAPTGIDETVLQEFEEIIIRSIESDTENALTRKATKIPVPNNSLDITSLVTSAYRSFLQREPDRKGLNYWVSKIKRGEITPEQAAELIGISEEAKKFRE